MPLIRPITDLRNTNEISDYCHKNNEPVFTLQRMVSIKTIEFESTFN